MDFTVLDIESNDKNPDTAKTVELGAALFRGGKEVGRGSVLVEPKAKIQIGATIVHGINEKDVAGARDITRAWAGLKLRTEAVVIYNGFHFDVPILERELAPLKPFEGRVIFDPFIWAQWYFPGLPSRTQASVCRAMDVDPGEHIELHSAAGDCILLGHLWLKMMAIGLVPTDVQEAARLQVTLRRAVEYERRAFNGLLYWRRLDGVVCVGQGTHIGKPVATLNAKQIDNLAARHYATDLVRKICAEVKRCSGWS